MGWTVSLTPAANKQLDSLDQPIRKRIVDFLYGRLAKLDEPRSIGHSLQGSQLGQFWRYRVGDYRILAKIEDDQLVILVVELGHRREIYR